MISQRLFNRWRDILGLFFIILFIGYNFFITEHIPAYPWWHSTGNDVDAANAATTVGLLNGTGFTHLYHPGATIYHFHGMTYRFLALFSAKHHQLLNLSRVQNIEDVFSILQTATQTSRILVFLTAVAFVVVFYFVVTKLTESSLLGFFITFYVATSKAFSWHTFWVRPDLPALLFFFLTLLWSIIFFKREFKPTGFYMAGLLLIGFLIGFTLFSKLQAIPVLIIYLFCVSAWLVWERKPLVESKALSKICLGLSFMNLIIMPWWALKRPEFITHEYLQSLHRLSDIRKLYGPAPDHFIWPVALILVGFLLLSVLISFLSVKFRERIVSMVLFWVTVTTGVIISIYVILLPVSVNIGQYTQNTNQIIYAMFTNTFFSPYLENKAVTMTSIGKIIQLHAVTSPILLINGFLIMVGVFLISLVQMFGRTLFRLRGYIPMFIFLVMGFLMDLMSSLRMQRPEIHTYYALYSICFYGVALGLFFAPYFHPTSPWKKINIRNAVSLFFILHIFWIMMTMKSPFVAVVPSDQTPLDEYMNTRGHAGPFWGKVEEIIRENTKK